MQNASKWRCFEKEKTKQKKRSFVYYVATLAKKNQRMSLYDICSTPGIILKDKPVEVVKLGLKDCFLLNSSNSTFWVVITAPNRHIASPLAKKRERKY